MRLPKHRLFDYNTPGKGVPEDEPPKTGIKLFGDILLRRFWKMVTLNLLYLLFSVPALIIMWFINYTLLMLFFSGAVVGDEQAATGITQLCMFLTCVLYALIGGGAPTAGMTYVLRNYREDRHSWVWADFKEKTRENLKQGTAVMVIDYVMLFLLGVNFWFYGMYASANAAAYILQGLMAVIFLIFLLIHCYIYPIMISFDLSVKDIYKYSLLLAVGKLPTSVASAALCLAFCLLLIIPAFFMPVFVFLFIPFIMFSFNSFINLFITYPLVKKYISKNEGAEK